MPSIGVLGRRVPGHVELFRKWDKLLHLMVRQNTWRLGLWFDYDELLNHARQGLWRAHETFDPDNGAGANFQTYARKVITNAFNALHHYSKADMRRDKVRSVSVDDDSVTDLHPGRPVRPRRLEDDLRRGGCPRLRGDRRPRRQE